MRVLQRDRSLLHRHVNWTRRWRTAREIYDIVNRRPVIDIEDTSGVRTRKYEFDRGQIVKIHEPSRERENIPLY